MVRRSNWPTLFLFGLICLGNLAGQNLCAQDLGIYMMSRDQVFRGRNPAIPFSKNTIIGLPEGNGILNRQTGTGDWLISQPDGSRKLSLAGGWEGLKGGNYDVNVSWGLRTFFIGKKFDRFQLGIYHEIEGNAFVEFNKHLVGILGFGNYGYLQKEPLAKEQPLDLHVSLKNEVFNGFGFQVGYQFNKWSLGGSFRYLSGLQELHTEVNQLTLDIRDPLAIRAMEDWKVYSANLIDELSLDSIQVIPFNEQDVLGRHPGLSGSVGISYQSPQALFAIQWKDIGSIQWKKGNVFSRNASTHYSGIEVPNLLTIDQNVFNSIGDTLKKIASVKELPQNYRTSLRSNILAEFQYTFSNKWTVGSAVNYYFNRQQWRAMAGINYQLLEILTLGSHFSYHSAGRLNLGIHAALRLAAFNLFINTDHIQSVYPTDDISQLSARAGISLMW